MKQRATNAEIEAMKERIEGLLDDAEAAHFAYESWMINWRIRMEQRAAKPKDATP